MELKSLNCPNCGASVDIPEGVSRFYCTYCGSQIQIDDGKITIDLNANINLNHQYSDVARLKELELQEQERERQELAAKKEKWKPVWWILALIGSIACYILFTFLAGTFNSFGAKFFAVLALIVYVGAPIALILTIPKHWRPSTERRQKGCIGCTVEIFACIMVAGLWFVGLLIPISLGWKW